MNAKDISLKFPVWQFLKQPVFSSQNRLILNPRRFEVSYRVQLLERCWNKQIGSKDSYFK